MIIVRLQQDRRSWTILRSQMDRKEGALGFSETVKEETTTWQMGHFFLPALTMRFWPTAKVVFGESLFIRFSSSAESPYLFAML
jgi:hypothetical protein